jgi:multiple sugar transport system substrate-binding protein
MGTGKQQNLTVEETMNRIFGSVLPCALAVGFTTAAQAVTIAVPNGSEGDGVRGLAELYSQQSGVQIEIVQAPYSNLFEQAATASQTRSGVFDVILMDDPWIPFFAENGFLEDLSSYLEAASGSAVLDDDFLSASRRLCQNPYGEGPFICFPFVGNAQLFFYDPEKFTEAGFADGPKTWDDVLAAGTKLTEEGGGRFFGYSMRAAEGNPVVADFMPILWSYGGQMFDADRNVIIDSAETRAAVDMFLKLAAISPPGVESFGADEVGRGIASGTVASSINWPNWVGTFENPSESRVVGKIANTTIPAGTNAGSSEIGHWTLGISVDSDEKQAAFDFLYWATRPEQIKLSADQFGNPPVRASVFTDAELTAQERFRHFPTLMAAIEASTPRPRHPRWPEIENEFGRELSALVAGTQTTEEALAASQSAIEAIIAR